MLKIKNKSSHKIKHKKPLNCIDIICWIIVPIAVIILLVLDGTGIYQFNKQRLLVIGACALVILIPFFSEVTIKNVSIKKNKK